MIVIKNISNSKTINVTILTIIISSPVMFYLFYYTTFIFFKKRYSYKFI